MSARVGGGSLVNKLEQVSSDGHQMSLVGGGALSSEVPRPAGELGPREVPIQWGPVSRVGEGAV